MVHYPHTTLEGSAESGRSKFTGAIFYFHRYKRSYGVKSIIGGLPELKSSEVGEVPSWRVPRWSKVLRWSEVSKWEVVLRWGRWS